MSRTPPPVVLDSLKGLVLGVFGAVLAWLLVIGIYASALPYDATAAGPVGASGLVAAFDGGGGRRGALLGGVVGTLFLLPLCVVILLVWLVFYLRGAPIVLSDQLAFLGEFSVVLAGPTLLATVGSGWLGSYLRRRVTDMD